MPVVTEPSERTLDEVVIRAFKLLGAIGTNANIWAALAKRGYSEAIHNRGWALALTANGYRKPKPAVLNDPAAASALAELDAWDEPNFRVAFVTLESDFPDQANFIFEDLEPATGAGAIGSVTLFLDRLDELEGGKDRKATRKADHAALEKLRERGFTKVERARLRGLLETATGAQKVAAEDGSQATAEADRRAAKRALWGWFNEWSEIARTEIKRRDHLILLGLAKRKPRKATAAKGGAKSAEKVAGASAAKGQEAGNGKAAPAGNGKSESAEP
jgi:hypothetical protein